MYLLTRNIYNKHKLLTVAVLLVCSAALGQNVTSPYSIIGIGDIETSYFNRTSGMANTGIAYRSSNSIILNNPASLSDLTNQLFIVELSGRGRVVGYSGSAVAPGTTGKDFAVDRFSLGIRATKFWQFDWINAIQYQQLFFQYECEFGRYQYNLADNL